MNFNELNFEPSLMEGLDAMNFQEMTPVQEQSIPLIMEGKDIIACAQTGTGKTAAYLLPLLNRMQKEAHDPDSVNAIIMAPTRELAQQIDQQLEGFSYFLPLSSVAVYGGNDAGAWEQQKRALQLGADFVVATPGRLISHISLDNVDFSKVSYFVLDEADRMLDMGFYDDIIQIVKKLPESRQTIMFSATMPPKIQKLAETILHDPVMVNIAISKPAEGIEQGAYVCYEAQKLQLLTKVLKQEGDCKAIVFSSAKLKVKEMARALRRMNMSVAEIHSDLTQEERDEALLDFKSGKSRLMVATDIVSRGIDIDDIELVINYDVPHDVEDYIHRIGRTARANRTGKGLTFISETDQDRFGRVENFLKYEINKLPMPEELGEGPEYAPRKGKGRGNSHGNNNRQGRNRQEHRNNHPRRDGNRNNNHQKNGASQNSAQPSAEVQSTPVENGGMPSSNAENRQQKKRRPYWKKRKSNGGNPSNQSKEGGNNGEN